MSHSRYSLCRVLNLAAFTSSAFGALLMVGIIFSRLYRHFSAERAFVRTGLGGQKVVLAHDWNGVAR